jgi:AAA15 family ATPase/GTPase
MELLSPRSFEEKTEIEIRKKEKPIEAQKVSKKVIKEISIGNFKAFANKQSIAIKPITLIFGSNSSGKSSIIHSLLYVHNAFTTGNLDPHYMKISGNSVDLGGFNQFVYKRKIETPIEWGIKISNLEFSKRLKEILFQTEDISINVAISQSYTERTKKVYDKENNKYVEIPTGELISRGNPQVTKYEIFTDNTLFLKMSTKSNKQMTIDFINLEYEAINQILEAIIEAKTSVLNFDKNEIHILRNAAQEVCQNIYTENNSFIPKNFSSLKIDIEQIFVVSKENHEKDLKNAVETFFPRLLNEILEGIYNSIDKTLRNLIYLGPLRSYPERHISFTKYNDPNWQAGGGLAWEIVRDNEIIRNIINNWLENEGKLKTPYRLEIKKLFKGSNALNDLVLIDKRSNTVVSHRDVGIGINQVLTMLTHAYAFKDRIITIEQPEIYLHPALQTELADVFIETAIKNNNAYIIETHSEHFILRILRRIKEGYANNNPELKIEDINIVYVKPTKEGSIVYQIPVTKDGDFETQWPDGFFPERGEELFL